ncbi:MAG: hypoxanthine phosphoribosyltransferase [Verrucomicrobiales bacterium]
MQKHTSQIPEAAPGQWQVPSYLQEEVAAILIPEAQITARLQVLGQEIQEDFAGKELVVVAILNGTIMFLADLIRFLEMPLHLDFIGVSSYGTGTLSKELAYTKELKLDVRGRHVLVVDDILDTGRTISRVIEKLKNLGAVSIKTCVLLDKAERRLEPIKPDFTAFKIPDLFVVGYGLDYAEKYRNLPFVGVLHPHIYKNE